MKTDNIMYAQICRVGTTYVNSETIVVVNSTLTKKKRHTKKKQTIKQVSLEKFIPLQKNKGSACRGGEFTIFAY